MMERAMRITERVLRVVSGMALMLTVMASGWSQMTSRFPENNASQSRVTRIAVVAIQNRSAQPISTTGLDATIHDLLLREELDVATVAFRAPADVEYQARLAGCNYILYTDIAEVRKSFTLRIGNIGRKLERPFGVKTSPGPDSYVAVVEFRLFAVDEVLPRISTMVSGKTGRLRPKSNDAASHELSFAFQGDSAGETAEPGDEDAAARQLQGKRMALAAALKRVAKAVRTTIETPRQVEAY
jgi:hypothetical protein